MGDGFEGDADDLNKMGASGNSNAARLTVLQDRKKIIEESLIKCNRELKQLCLEEADLTGIVPLEMPLEPGESPPLIRRRVGTAYQLPESLLKHVNNNNKDETVSDLELQMQLHANMAEAALGLANEQNISKTLRRQHMSDYQQHKDQYGALQEKLTSAKDKVLQDQQHKQKKKPRPEQDDNILLATNVGDNFVKSSLRHSLRSNKCVSVVGDSEFETAHYPSTSRPAYKSYVEANYQRQEDPLARNFYHLSLNGYKHYMENMENVSHPLPSSTYNTLQSASQLSLTSQLQGNHYQNQSYQTLVSQQRPNVAYSNLTYPKSVGRASRQSSPNLASAPKIYYNNAETQSMSNYHLCTGEIQPHQQYEHMSSGGLGGYWKKMDSGEVVWCHSSSPVHQMEPNWQRDKRFGSLDRRRKRINKRISPSVDHKSATLATMPSSTYAQHVRTAAIKSPRVLSKRNHDQMQLVRTQSLGSVGVQALDCNTSLYPSDDNNSSCESDNRSLLDADRNARSHKPKQWTETSLDGPVAVSPTQSIRSRSQSTLPIPTATTTVLSPEEKYIPLINKQMLEIPAESNPSHRPIPETKGMDMFNVTMPKNCTVVQAGQCKPYHEETKPFEMSDFYKYSTKYKKSPAKMSDTGRKTPQAGNSFLPINLNDTYDNANANNSNSMLARADNSGSLNASLDLNTNVAERFSDEMNTWYKNHKLCIENNPREPPVKGGKSTATLV